MDNIRIWFIYLPHPNPISIMAFQPSAPPQNFTLGAESKQGVRQAEAKVLLHLGAEGQARSREAKVEKMEDSWR